MLGQLSSGDDRLFLTIPRTGSFAAGNERPDTEYSGSKVHLKTPQNPFQFQYLGKAEVTVLGVQADALRDFISALNADRSDLTLGSEETLSVDAETGAMLGRYAEFLWDETFAADFEESPNVVRALEASVLAALSVSLDRAGARALLPASGVPSSLARRAEAYIAEHFGDPITLAEITRAAGAPVRSLTRAFRESYEMSPMEMVRTRRLHAVRDILSGADPEDLSVTEAALSVGIGNLGRFSTAYRKTFGEVPSKTLARRRRRH